MKNNWKIFKLDEATDYINRGVSPVYTENNSGTSVVNQKCIRDGQVNFSLTRLTDESIKAVPCDKLIQSFDILINSTGTGTVGRVGQVNEINKKITIDSHVTVVRPNKKIVDPIFFGQQIKFKEKYIESLASGSTNQIELSRQKLANIDIVIPPIETQQKIALILSTIDEEIQKTDQIIETTEKLKEGLVSRIFFGEKYKTIKIRDVFKTSSGGTPLVKNKEYYENGTIAWLNSGEVSQGYIYSSNKKITELGLKKSSAKIFPTDTVLVAMYGVTAGKVGILKIESSTNQAICGIYPNNDYLPEFLYQYLKTQTDFLLKQGIGAAQPNISQETIKNINIPCFSILEQKKITEILNSLDFKISEDKKSKSKLTSLKNGLMNDVFNQKVEVLQ